MFARLHENNAMSAEPPGAPQQRAQTPSIELWQIVDFKETLR